MVLFKDPAVLDDFIDSQLSKPIAFKIDSVKRSVCQSQDNFGSLKTPRSIPQLVDFDSATTLEKNGNYGVWPIQPDHYWTPEVILGNRW